MGKSTRWISSFAALGLAVGMTFAGAAPAMAATEVTVCATGCDYTEIQPAVNTASAGDTIIVSAGTYTESVTIDKTLTLVGPNAAISPNSADPLIPNAARSAEAIIEPPAGEANHAFIVKGDGVNVTISGFTVDLASGAKKQLYLRGGQLKNSHVAVTRNLFLNANEPNEGWVWFNGDLGNITLTATDNRFSNGAAGNGFRVYNGAGSGAGSTELNIQDNVFIDNAAWSINNSTSEVATSGTIAGNWFGNSAPTAPDVTHFGTMQSGLVLAGAYTNFNLSNNTFKHLTATSVYLYSTISGTMTINGNTFDGYNTETGGAVITVSDPAGGDPVDVSGITVTDNTFINPVGNAIAAINRAGAGTLNLSHNRWDVSPVTQMSGPNIQLDSWTLLGSDPQETVVRVAENGSTVEFDEENAPGAPTITVPAGAISGSGTFEYFVRSIGDSGLPSETPFDTASVIVFDLSLEADGAVDGVFMVCVDAEDGMRLWHAEGGVWKDVTIDNGIPGKLCGEVTSFSPFGFGWAGGAGSQLAATGMETQAVAGMLALFGVLTLSGLGLLVTSRRAARRVQ